MTGRSCDTTKPDRLDKRAMNEDATITEAELIFPPESVHLWITLVPC